MYPFTVGEIFDGFDVLLGGGGGEEDMVGSVLFGESSLFGRGGRCNDIGAFMFTNLPIAISHSEHTMSHMLGNEAD